MIICIEIMEVFQNHTDWQICQSQEMDFNYHHLSPQPHLCEFPGYTYLWSGAS